jgi:cytochrome o ubiquinol oxidase subunit 1
MDMIFGKLGWDSIPTEPIVLVTMVMMALGGIAVVGGITYFKKWGYLWNEWFTSVDHKKIGIMYIIVSVVMLLRGFADAIMMRLQLFLAKGGGEGYLHPDHYDQIFHRTRCNHDLLRSNGSRCWYDEHLCTITNRCS